MKWWKGNVYCYSFLVAFKFSSSWKIRPGWGENISYFSLVYYFQASSWVWKWIRTWGATLSFVCVCMGSVSMLLVGLISLDFHLKVPERNRHSWSEKRVGSLEEWLIFLEPKQSALNSPFRGHSLWGAQHLMNLTRIQEDAGSIPCLVRWVKELALLWAVL